MKKFLAILVCITLCFMAFPIGSFGIAMAENTEQPALTGVAIVPDAEKNCSVGAEIGVDVQYTCPEGQTPVFTYQWQSSALIETPSFENIPDATGETYTVKEDDLFQLVRVYVTFNTEEARAEGIADVTMTSNFFIAGNIIHGSTVRVGTGDYATLTDGDINTYYRCYGSANDYTVTIDLGSMQMVNRLDIMHKDTPIAVTSISYAAEDGSDAYTEITKELCSSENESTEENPLKNAPVTVRFPGVQARYIQLKLHKFLHSGGRPGIWEIALSNVTVKPEVTRISIMPDEEENCGVGAEVGLNPELIYAVGETPELCYQWQVCNSMTGDNFQDISGETGAVYTVKEKDAYKLLRARVTFNTKESREAGLPDIVTNSDFFVAGDLIHGKTVTAAATAYGTTGANVVDGNLNTWTQYYSGSGKKPGFTVDLGKEQAVNRIDAICQGLAITDAQLSYSSDGTSYTPVAQEEMRWTAGDRIFTVKFPTVRANFMKLELTADVSGSNPGIRELVFFNFHETLFDFEQPDKTHVTLTADQYDVSGDESTLMIAFYEENQRLLSVENTALQVQNGEVHINGKTWDVPENAFIAKALLWDSLEAMHPIAYAELEIGEDERDLQLIRERIIKESGMYSADYDPAEVMAQLIKDEDGTYTGRFEGIDYDSQSQHDWSPSNALANITNLLRAYYSEGNVYYGDPELKQAIDAGLQDWADHQYKSTNWWYNDIDVPQKLSQILLYPLEQDAAYMPALRDLANRGVPKFDTSTEGHWGDAGANLLDKLLSTVKIAAGTMNAETMEDVQLMLDHELDIFESQGIMADMSFQQHGARLYNGTYGSVFCNGVNKLLGYLKDTKFMVSDRAVNTYADFILDGHSMMFRENETDFSTVGRQLANWGGSANVKNNCLGAVDILTQLPGVERKEELLALKENRLGDTDSGYDKAKHFWRSDFTVLQRPNFYISIRNSSTRVLKAESMGINENAAYVADGWTIILRSADEYNNLFNSWDWNHIPGTTTPYTSDLRPEQPSGSWKDNYGSTDFVGGVSNGKYAVTALDYVSSARKDGVSASAKKANFLFEDGFTALGTNISGNSNKGDGVTTTVNQNNLNGSVVYQANAVEGTLDAGAATTLENPDWVLHDRIGYYFPDSEESLSVKAENQIFNLFLNHGNTPEGESYSYTVLPEIEKASLQAYAENPDMITLSNTEKVQSVWSKKAQTAGVVFWEQETENYKESITIPASVTGLGDDLVLTADQPCIVMLSITGGGMELSVSNPKNNDMAVASFTVNRALSGDGAENIEGGTVITIPLPQGLDSGKSVTVPLRGLD